MNPATYAELCRVLRHQGSLLERLVFATTSLRLLLGCGEGRFLAQAADDVHDLFDALGVVEALRAGLTVELARQVGLMDDDPSVDALAAALPVEEGARLRQLGQALREGMAELATLAADGAGLAALGLDRLQELLDRADRGLAASAGPGATYAPGGWSSPVVSPAAFDGGA